MSHFRKRTGTLAGHVHRAPERENRRRIAVGKLHRTPRLPDRMLPPLAGTGLSPGIAQGNGPSPTRDGKAQRGAQLECIGWRHDAHTRHRAQIRQIEGAVVRGSISAHKPGAVHGKDHVPALQGHVHHDLVVGALQKRRVDGHDGHLAARRQRRRHADGVFFCDADIEEALRELLAKRVQPRARAHRRRDGHHALVVCRQIHERVGKRIRIGRAALGRDRLARRNIERTHAVEALGVRLGGRISPALVGHGMHDHRAFQVLRAAQNGLKPRDVVAVDRSYVGDAELLEKHRAVRQDELLHRLFHRIARIHERAPHAPRRRHGALHLVAQVRVLVRKAHLPQVMRKPAHVGRDGHAVVV